jgi:hypothetical protein
MPALITHHIFGEHSAKLLPEGVISNQEELLAYLLGNQGPDPFFFRALAAPDTVKKVTKLGSSMHHDHVAEAFQSLRRGVNRLPEEDQALGRAWVLGVLSHYALDRSAHPYVFAYEDAIIENGDESMADAHSQVHAVIEGRIDSWLLDKERGVDVTVCPPDRELCRSDRTDKVAGALMSQMAREVFGVEIGPDEYGHAVDNMRLVYKLIEPAGSLGAAGIGRIENLVRDNYSLVSALAHETDVDDAHSFANTEHRPWTDRETGRVSTESFMDRFDAALVNWPQLAEAFIRDENFENEVAGLDYSGHKHD